MCSYILCNQQNERRPNFWPFQLRKSYFSWINHGKKRVPHGVGQNHGDLLSIGHLSRKWLTLNKPTIVMGSPSPIPQSWSGESYNSTQMVHFCKFGAKLGWLVCAIGHLHNITLRRRQSSPTGRFVEVGLEDELGSSLFFGHNLLEIPAAAEKVPSKLNFMRCSRFLVAGSASHGGWLLKLYPLAMTSELENHHVQWQNTRQNDHFPYLCQIIRGY